MGNLEYSTNALEVKGAFYAKDITVYVEGDDDVMFWDNVFRLANKLVHIEEVGGKPNLSNYIRKVIKEDAQFVIAMDNDNSEFMLESDTHPRIIRTYGYSIENSMYFDSANVERIVSAFCRKPISVQEEFEFWKKDFANSLFNLIVYDIASCRFKKGIKVFGDSCQRFLKNDRSHTICEIKVSDYLDKISNRFLDSEIEEVKSLLIQDEKDLWFLIKGHFIRLAFVNIIKSFVKKLSNRVVSSFSSEHVYASTIDCFVNWESRHDLFSIISLVSTQVD